MGRPFDSWRPRTAARRSAIPDDTGDPDAQVHPVFEPAPVDQTRDTTFFAPAGRSTREELMHELSLIASHPVVDGLLHTVGGMLAVLNERRQVLAVNRTFLETTGIRDPQSVLGLRPGDAIRCVHSQEPPDGCGTTRFCSSCGAAIAIVACLDGDRMEERNCAATVKRNGSTSDMFFRVRACPLGVDDRHMVLLFMQDITADQKRAALEWSFYHDVSNIVLGLVGASRALGNGSAASDRMKTLTARLADEVAIQKVLSTADVDEYRPVLRWVSVAQVIRELREIFANHPAAADKMLILRAPASNTRIKTDFSMLVRVLCNMVVNALEATEDGGKVKLWVEDGHSSVSFCVWNRGHIPGDAAKRIFQRNFSTKEGFGRGVGSWTMKLLCENYLDAQIGFTTSEAEGTVFRARIPGGMLD
jgi:hypothetical protein